MRLSETGADHSKHHSRVVPEIPVKAVGSQL